MTVFNVQELLTSARPTLIAELHPQHQGRLDLLKEMMLVARESGVDLCKIQIYDSLKLLGSKLWQYLEYSDKQLDELFSFSFEIEMPLFASVFSIRDYERTLHYQVPAYKLASRTLFNNDLVKTVMDSGKPVICSLGGWDKKKLPYNKHHNLFYLDCVPEYPTPIEKCTYGFRDFSNSGIDGVSDHSVGVAVAIAAIAHGARVVERHMTLTPYRWCETEKAHLCSSTPEEFKLIRSLGDRIAITRKNCVAHHGV